MPLDPAIAGLVEAAEVRWKCKAHAIPNADPIHDPNILFTREPNVEAIGVAHARLLSLPFDGADGFECSLLLWRRARFMASALAFVVIVEAPDGRFFCTVKDFDKDAIHYKRRARSMDSPELWLLPRDKFTELKPDGAKLGPGHRSD